MRTLCKHIFASAERKFKTVILSLGGTLTLMQECFKNIRDVDKKIRLLEFYVFGNVTVYEIADFVDYILTVLTPYWICSLEHVGSIRGEPRLTRNDRD